MTDTTQDRVEYGPSRALGVSLTAVWLTTAGVLVWVGSVLGPESVDAMDGFTRILFTAVPIRVFAWTMAIVFAAIGLATARALGRPGPSLTLSADGVTLRSGAEIPWHRIDAVESEEFALRIRLTPEAATAGGGRWLGRRDPNRIVLSAFQLGGDPRAVARELEGRRPPRSSPDLPPSETSST